MSERYAVIDTDFIIKALKICNSVGKSLLELILEMPGYRFFCHDQICSELKNSGKSYDWLMDMVEKGLIHRYSDEDIVSELVPYYGQLTVAVCIEYLRKSCLPFGMELEKNFPNTIRSLKEGTREYLNTLKCDCDNIGSGNNLGEIKSYMLIQLLKFLNGEKIYVFCSDDKTARNGLLLIGEVRCISILSSFVRLKKESGINYTELKEYYDSYVSFCAENGQNTFKIHENTQEGRMLRISAENVLDEVYKKKIIDLKNGELKYC